MKKINIILLVSLWFLAGCNDEFLDTFPKTQINDENFWSNPSDLATYNNQLYAAYFNSEGFGRGGFNGGMLTADNLSDNAYVQIPGDVRLGIHTSNNPGRSDWNWTLVRDINQMLENAEGSPIEEAQKNQYIAEARLLRALDYYDKLKLYGSLPIIDRVLTEDDELLYASQSSRDEVMAFIMSDLDFAEQWMVTSAVPNRFSKTIAQAYKARIMLHEGTFRKYHALGNETTYLEEAAQAAQAVINSGEFMIEVNSDYNALFANINLNGNKEVVFFRDYDEALQIFHNVSNIITHVDGAEFGGTKDLINDYLCTDGLPIGESPLYKGDATISDEFSNRDKRLAGTFAQPNTYFVGDKLFLNTSPQGVVNTASPSGYQVAKFYNESQDVQAWDRAFIDAPLIRYAEILLIYAEAKAELGTITQSDVDMSINQLRTKAGVADLMLNATIIEDIRRERRVELAFEGFRYDDLMRWKQGSKLAQPVLGLKFNENDIADIESFEVGVDILLNEDDYIQSNNTYAFDESKNYYFPIPVNELSLNPNLNQTPGWE
ncbi:RagB/SusD family nutrient uptake outer membrane protein [Algoriphagus halophytocola]|uniref:RagB/SusD family nutrient uptake outer membrane protein n=1 Tax=Algoriphagus halophytocola TaxID=2991499 RepID=A0ABY6MPU0_9BACT|nr:RagB/SusD family nutrient uptake outer membrane protein [Algoriphagus sp. TR-M5]UZD24399.1 RagB/SusD family nutrient uptake outer membrane protein [Algoriphagus sp. TR-M5]